MNYRLSPRETKFIAVDFVQVAKFSVNFLITIPTDPTGRKTPAFPGIFLAHSRINSTPPDLSVKIRKAIDMLHLKEELIRPLLIVGVVSLLIFSTMNSAAMMGSHGSRNSGRSGGDRMGGTMGGDGQQMSEQTQPARSAYQPPGAQRTSRYGISREAARDLVDNYLRERATKPYHLRKLKEYDTYYMVEVIRPDGSLLSRLIIDKQSGDIHSLP